MFLAPFPVGGSVLGVRGDFVGSAAGNAETSFANVPFGTPESNRCLVAVLFAYSSGAVSGVAIGGVSATQIASQSNGDVQISAWIAPVPTGLSGPVGLSWDGEGSAAIALYALYGTSHPTSPIATGDETGNLSLTLPAGAFVIGAGCAIGSANGWSGLGLDDNIESGAGVLSVASAQFGGAGNLAAQCNLTVSEFGAAYIAMAWGS